MECKFVVGQKVVCINSKGWVNTWGDDMDGPGPKCGEIYQISEIIPETCDIFLKFKEFEADDPYARFLHTSFRPLEEQENTISELRKLLVPSEPELVS